MTSDEDSVPGMMYATVLFSGGGADGVVTRISPLRTAVNLPRSSFQ